jgi:SPOR domain
VRTLVLLLLLANLSLFAYTRLDASHEGEAVRLAEQVQPDKIRLLTPQQVAALGPAKVAALADVCIEWGPLSEVDRARALADLEPLVLGKLLTQRRIETALTHWVFLPPAANRTEAERRAADARSKGVGDVSIVETGAQRFAVSLGAYPNEDAARIRLAQVIAQGLTNAKAGPRQQVIVHTMLAVRDPQATVIAKLRDLVPAYPGSEAKVGSCEKTP